MLLRCPPRARASDRPRAWRQVLTGESWAEAVARPLVFGWSGVRRTRPYPHRVPAAHTARPACAQVGAALFLTGFASALGEGKFALFCL